MMNKKKNNAFTAFLITLSFLAPTISIFWIQHTYGNASPLSNAKVTFTYPDAETPIVGLEVYLYKEGGSLITGLNTGADGKVTFTGLTTQNFYYTWSWQDNEVDRQFTLTTKDYVKLHTLDYWTITKTFLYPDEHGVEGLEVTLKGEGIGAPTRTTPWSGKVTFGTDCHIIAGEYTLEWTWDGVEYSEAVTIGFDTPSPVELADVTVPLKSGGGKYLRLADSVRFALPTAVK